MDENNKDLKNEGGELSGFDSVSQSDVQQEVGQQPQQPQGYTVTPEGGFYTKQKSDIIQDQVVQDNPQPQQPPKTDFKPNGSYGTQPDNNFNHFDPFTGTPVDANPYVRVKKPKVKKEHQRYSVAVVAVAAVLAALIGAGSGIAAVMMTRDNNSSNLPTTSGNSASNVNINVDESVESVVQAVAEKATQSVVGIRTTTSVNSFFGGSNESTGEGSGVIYTADGYIITNYHVIESVVESSSTSKIEVFLGADTEDSHEATVIGYNISSDLAVIKINASGLTPAEIGNSEDLKVGQYVITIGSPGGLEFMGSVTYGVISGLNRVVSSSSNVELIQTDAAINPGNSGGALLNTSGQLIGINSSKIVSTEFEGMGFSIPIDTVVEKCKKIIEKQNDPEPYIGITVSEKYTAEVLEYYGYPSGAVVLSVDDSSPAADAGIQRGDIITEFNGTQLTSYSMLGELLSDCTPGKSVAVKIYRSGRYYSTNIAVASNNASK